MKKEKSIPTRINLEQASSSVNIASVQTNNSNFLQKQFEDFIFKNYSQLYDFFEKMVKDKRKTISTIKQDKHSRSPSQKNKVLLDDSSDDELYQSQLQKRNSAGVDTLVPQSLYVPPKQTSFTQQQEEKKAKEAETEFKSLLQSLSTQYSKQVCEKNPILETLMEEIDDLNQDAINQKLGHKEAQSKAQSRFNSQKNSLSELMKPLERIDSVEEYKKQIGKLQDKIKEIESSMLDMRKAYYKDLMIYKSQQEKIKEGKMKEEDMIQVDTFTGLQGLDKDVIKMVNDKIIEAKKQFEKRLQEHTKFENGLNQKIFLFNRLSPDAYSIVNLTLDKIIENLKVKTPDVQELWDAIEMHYGTDCFLNIIDKRYRARFTIDPRAMDKEIDKVRLQADLQFREITKATKEEISVLRRTIEQQSTEIVELKNNQIKEIEKINRQASVNAYREFMDDSSTVSPELSQQKLQLFQSLQINEKIDAQYQRLIDDYELKFTFLKLQLMAQFNKFLKSTQQNLNPEEPAYKLLQQTLTKLCDILQGKIIPSFIYKTTEFNQNINQILTENYKLNCEVKQRKMKQLFAESQNVYFEQKMTDLADEVQMYQSKYESVKEENRQLKNQYKMIRAELENAKGVRDIYEKDRQRILNEVQKIVGTNDKLQNVIQESFINQQKAMSYISSAGVQALNKMFSDNMKDKGVVTMMKDINCEIEMAKKNSDGEYFNVMSALAEKTQQEIQTEGGFQFISDADMDKFKMLETEKNYIQQRAHLVEEKLRMLNDEVDTLQTKPQTRNSFIQCELLMNRQVSQESPPQHSQSMTESINVEFKDVTPKPEIVIPEFKQPDLSYYKQFLKQGKKQKSSYPKFDQVPEVFKRQWMDISSKARRYELIKQQYEKLRNQEWMKSQTQVMKKASKIYKRDANTGKMFINLVELYKDAQMKQVMEEEIDEAQFFENQFMPYEFSVQQSQVHTPSRKIQQYHSTNSIGDKSTSRHFMQPVQDLRNTETQTEIKPDKSATMKIMKDYSNQNISVNQSKIGTRNLKDLMSQTQTQPSSQSNSRYRVLFTRQQQKRRSVKYTLNQTAQQSMYRKNGEEMVKHKETERSFNTHFTSKGNHRSETQTSKYNRHHSPGERAVFEVPSNFVPSQLHSIMDYETNQDILLQTQTSPGGEFNTMNIFVNQPRIMVKRPGYRPLKR